MKGSAINHADVLIIGGASGAVAVKHLAEPGPYVMCLEAAIGPIVPRFLVHSRIGSSAASSSGRLTVAGRPGDYPIDVTDSDISIMNFNGGGGGAIVSVGRVRELMGYPGQQARPVTAEGFPAYIAEGLLDHLVGR